MKTLDITSKENEKIKLLKKLQQKKYRDEHSLFVVENLSTIYDALKSGFIPESLFVTDVFKQQQPAKLELILKKPELKSFYVINQKLNKIFSNLETPSGICAVYPKPKTKLNPKQNIIYLNHISEPGNWGTILRSALAFSIHNIVIDKHCTDVYNPKTIHASKDSIFKLNLEFDQGYNLLHKLKGKMKIFSTSLQGQEDLNIFKTKDKFCLVLGNETRGVDPKIENLSDNLVKIKISKQIESLNVAVAAGILLYEISKK